MQSWAGVYSCRELSAINDQLCLLKPKVGMYFPVLPEEPTGVWAYIMDTPSPEPHVCQDIHDYIR